jgi:hypothetical protein
MPWLELVLADTMLSLGWSSPIPSLAWSSPPFSALPNQKDAKMRRLVDFRSSRVGHFHGRGLSPSTMGALLPLTEDLERKRDTCSLDILPPF